MAERLPSGFRCCEDYSVYVRTCGCRYRGLVRGWRAQERNRLGFLELGVRRLNRCLEVAFNR